MIFWVKWDCIGGGASSLLARYDHRFLGGLGEGVMSRYTAQGTGMITTPSLLVVCAVLKRNGDGIFFLLLFIFLLFWVL